MKPYVTIVCLAHNHRDYIRDAMDGFLMQETDFPFEIIMHDDCSTDGTADIIREYEARYPGRLRGIYEECNRFSESMSVWYDFLYSKIESKYIALCDGDDYWTDPLKLSKQIKILDSDDSLVVCCTGASLADEQGHTIIKELTVVPDNRPGRYSIREFILQGHVWPVATVVFRNRNKEEVFKRALKMENSVFGDWSLWVALLCEGDGYFLKDVTAAYRQNPHSATHTDVDFRRMAQARLNFTLMPIVAGLLPKGYEDVREYLLKDTAWMWWKLANAYKHSRQYLRMTGCLLCWAYKKIEHRNGKKD